MGSTNPDWNLNWPRDVTADALYQINSALEPYTNSGFHGYNIPIQQIAFYGQRNKMVYGKRRYAGSAVVTTTGQRSRTLGRRRRAARPQLRYYQRGFLRTGGYYRYAAGAPGKELKFFDTSFTDSNGISATGQIVQDSVNEVVQDVSENGRVGRNIYVKSLLINGLFKAQTQANDAAGVNDMIRTIVYIDHQTNGATATVGQILEQGDILSHNNLENSKRFKILKNFIMSVHSPAGGGDVGAAESNWGGMVIPYKCIIKFKTPLKIEFNGATGAITEMSSNNLGIMQISFSGDSNVTSEFCTRIRYTD